MPEAYVKAITVNEVTPVLAAFKVSSLLCFLAAAASCWSLAYIVASLHIALTRHHCSHEAFSSPN